MQERKFVFLELFHKLMPHVDILYNYSQKMSMTKAKRAITKFNKATLSTGRPYLQVWNPFRMIPKSQEKKLQRKINHV